MSNYGAFPIVSYIMKWYYATHISGPSKNIYIT